LFYGAVESGFREYKHNALPNSEGLETSNIEQKRKIIKMLDVHGKLSIENEEKVVYVKCILGQQLLSVARTLHWSNNHNRHPVPATARLVLENLDLDK
jgi:hypothetical protein